ncbi:MAG: hypothetical protein HQ483_16615 [Rhodospirillales bacterium]|nr:hypothetical protein [Rhodospirillales bacterium]
MALQNRITPGGEIIADPARGTLMGNRGILHKPDKTLGIARWRHKAWISCLLEFRARHSEVMPSNGYTRLFFLDEAVALAAGHRPCAECRRDAYTDFKNHWLAGSGLAACRAADMDRQFHQERVAPRSRQQFTRLLALDDIPDGGFVSLADTDAAFLVVGDALFAYSPARYALPVRRPAGIQVRVHTPPAILNILQAGYRPRLHPSITGGSLPA